MTAINHKSYLGLAIPFMISTVTHPLLGAVDTAVVGRLGSPTFIGGVAIGSVIFNTLYWLFGFLRVSTSGFSAQSLGSGNPDDSYFAYLRPVAIAVVISFLFVLLQQPIINGAMMIYKADPEVTRHAVTYFNILIWGAPLVLVYYVNLGWLMGRKHVKESLFLQISTNLMNIGLDILFVMVFRFDVAGVAWATLISQAYGFALSVFLISRKLQILSFQKYWHDLFEIHAIKKMIRVNSDLMIRTACLLTMTNMFVAKGSALGASFLAANAVLFQLQYIIAYCFDGLSNAGSVFAGKAVGEKNLSAFQTTIRITNVHLVILSVISSLILFLFQDSILGLFTNLESVQALCKTYMIWIILFPFVISIGLVYSGFYTGATYTAPVRNSLVISLMVFVGVYYTTIPFLHNHGLWLSFILFSLCRSSVLLISLKRLIRDIFSPIGSPANEKQGAL